MALRSPGLQLRPEFSFCSGCHVSHCSRASYPADPAYYNSCGPAPTSLLSPPPPYPPPPAPLLNINPAAAGSGCKLGWQQTARSTQKKLTE